MPSYGRYTDEELATLVRLWSQGMLAKQIAPILDRSPRQIHDKLKEMRRQSGDIVVSRRTRDDLAQIKRGNMAAARGRLQEVRAARFAEPRPPREEPVVLVPFAPGEQRFKDDPRAASDRQPRLMIAPSIYRCSASSSLLMAMQQGEAR